MKFEISDIPQSQHSQLLHEVPEPQKIQVTLLDHDNLPLARGIATLPMLFGAGVFWPACPMPSATRLATAKCFTLPTGESMSVKSLKLSGDSPPRYDFRVNSP